MTRLFIADSEDEDEDVSPQSPAPVVLPPLPNGQSSDPLSRGTDSTDTAFFKSVYYEQTQAIQERTQAEAKGVRAASTKRVSGGEGMWEVPSSPDPQPASTRRKRRKLSNDEGTNPVTSKDQLADTSSMLPPTLQIDDETAFVITPSAMTKSQREQYHPMDYGSSIGQDPVSTLRAPGQRLVDLTSSSSGTNLNSPRTVGGLTQGVISQDGLPNGTIDTLPPPSPVQVVQEPSSRSRRLSSPDVIALPETTDYEEHYHEPTGDDEDVRAEVFAAEEVQDLKEYHEPIVIEDEDSAFEDTPVKPKKKRGRPKKTEGKKSTVAAEPTPEEPIATDKPTVAEKPAKKKRGRPKKNSITPNKSEAIVAEESPPLKQQEPSHVEDDERPIDAEVTEDLSTEVAHKSEEEDEAIKPKKEKGKTKTQAPSGKIEKSQEGSSLPDQKTPKAPEGKPPQITSQSEGKPMYRVGLSKRTRIAPLLKIVRK
ncbi:hypothetical protein CC79DRAFT_1328165 [Sarocladium strictum]